MVSLILVERHPPVQSSPIQEQSSTSNIFLCLPQEILESMHPHIMHCILTIFPFQVSLLSCCLFQQEMALERSVKDIQASQKTLHLISLAALEVKQ